MKWEFFVGTEEEEFWLRGKITLNDSWLMRAAYLKEIFLKEYIGEQEYKINVSLWSIQVTI